MTLSSGIWPKRETKMSILFSFFLSTVDEHISKDCDLRLENIWLLSLALSLFLNRQREGLLQGDFMLR